MRILRYHDGDPRPGEDLAAALLRLRDEGRPGTAAAIEALVQEEPELARSLARIALGLTKYELATLRLPPKGEVVALGLFYDGVRAPRSFP